MAGSVGRVLVGLASIFVLGCGDGSSEPADTEVEGPVRIMPIGDSITAGPYYRIPLARAVAAGDCEIDFVGTFTGVGGDSLPDADQLDLDHQGVGGATSAAIQDQLDGWLLENQPDVALVYLGINDFYNDVDRTQTVENLEAVVASLREARPGVRILLAEIMPGVSVERGVEALNRRIVELGRRLDSTASPVATVDMATGVSVDTDLVDGIHPTEEQSAEMAAIWAEALRGVLDDRCEL